MVFLGLQYSYLLKLGSGDILTCYIVDIKWLPRGAGRNIVCINAICLADLLVSLGSPRAMETLSVLPAGLSAGKSESPGEKVRVRVPPPPHPSFFTATVILKGSTETTGCQGNALFASNG